MLKIDNLKASLEEEKKQIIKGLSLSIKPGEVHAIMGPNGSGKSTLSSILAGKDGYVVDGGTVQYEDDDLLALEIEAAELYGVAAKHEAEALTVATVSDIIRGGEF